MPPKKAPAKKLHELATEVRVGHRITDVNKKVYIVGKQFATGGFGRIHTCTEEGKSHQMVMKIEPSTNGPLLTEVVVFNRILKQEHLEAYKKKKKIQWIGLPYLIANGFFTYGDEKMRYMVIPKYATSLEAARLANGGTLSIKDSLTVTKCILDALEYLHSVEYTHADVKAANILLEKEGIYSSAVLVDFGLAHKTTNNVDKPDKKRAHNGTCIFTSTDAHRGNNPSFRGDVEILAYNIIMWLKGDLPWLSLEASPDKVFDAKQKLINGLPGTLENVLQGTSSGVIECLATMFDIAMKTGYTSKVDMARLGKAVEAAIQKAPGAEKSKKKKPEAAAETSSSRKSTRRPVKEDEDEEEMKPKARSVRAAKSRKVVVSDEEEDDEVEEKPKKTPSRTKSRRVVDEDDEEEEEEVYIPKSSKSRRKLIQEDDDDDKPDEKETAVKTPSTPGKRSTRTMRLGLTSSTASTNFAAKKIEQKYKRLSMNKSSMVPVAITVSPNTSSSPTTSSGRKRTSDEGVADGETITLKTPALVRPAVKKAKYKTGISSATKASPTELRRVPGVRNFPKGRRSIIIKETAAKYSERRARQNIRQTFNDSNCSGGSSEL